MFGRRRKQGDPGPSPVGWLCDEVWRGWNEGDVDGARTKVPGRPIGDAWPTPVTAADRERAPVAPVPAGALVPPAGSVDEHAALLDGTPGGGFLSSVRWPVCCDRLTTLVVDTGGGLDFAALERVAGPLDGALTDAHVDADGEDMRRFWRDTLAAMRAGEHGGDGIDFFQCRACGRVYGATCEP